MEANNRSKILIGIILILLVINVSALATFLYNNYSKQRRFNEIRKTQEQVQISGVHRYMREELKLTDDQFKQFNEIGRSNFINSRDIAFKLDEKRIEFIDELTKDNPDDEKLNSLAREIGDLHYELKMNTIKHYFEFKELCNPEQQKALEKLFMKMIQREDRFPIGRPERERDREWKRGKDSRPNHGRPHSD
jgi:Spy/CpxP family protein refolding chaperone